MRPNGKELLQGLQGTLATYILPELQTDHARMELMLATAILGLTANEWDGAAQRLVDENAALRGLAGQAADVLAAADVDERSMVEELRALSHETDASVRLSGLTDANERLHAAIGSLSEVVSASDLPALRSLRTALIDQLRDQADARALSLLGPRSDG